MGNSIYPQVEQSGTGYNKNQVIDKPNKLLNKVAQGFKNSRQILVKRDF